MFESRKESGRKNEEAQRLQVATFPEGLLPGTGSERWSHLWESAREFSEGLAYQDQSFPVVENGARCVLCQQDLDHAATHRLRQFEAFVVSTTERELKEARDKFARLQKSFVDLKTTSEAAEEAIKEIRIEHDSLVNKITSALANTETRRRAVVEALSSGQQSPSALSAVTSVWQEIDACRTT